MRPLRTRGRGRFPVVLIASAFLACSSSRTGPEGASPAPRPDAPETGAAGASAPQASASPALPAQAPEEPSANAATVPYTEVQAERGLGVYRQVCSDCHYRSDFRGAQFDLDWGGRTVRDFYRTIVTSMPEDDPGGLDAQQYIDVVTFLLSLNGYPAGEEELKPDEEALRAYTIAPSGS